VDFLGISNRNVGQLLTTMHSIDIFKSSNISLQTSASVELIKEETDPIIVVIIKIRKIYLKMSNLQLLPVCVWIGTW
jgi:hypothetical protein